jgi:hypothetical protein
MHHEISEPDLAPKNMSLPSLLSANDWQRFSKTQPGLAPKTVSLPSLLSANDWQRFLSRTFVKKGVSPVSPVRQ